MRICHRCLHVVDEIAERCPACGNPTDVADELIGETLPGGFRIEELIGVGGMGMIYRAEQIALGRTVAVKVLHAHLLQDATIPSRFMSEARLASQLNHPNSIAVIDFGRTFSGQLYLVMEYLRGRDLARVVAEDGLLPVHRILGILGQLLDVLGEAHRLGILHRDLKPENIVIETGRGGEDVVKVVDFGLAKLFGMPGAGITAAGTVCGTPDYMSPEQCGARPVDPRSDLYAVGINMFVLLTGRHPFPLGTPTQMMLAQMITPPPDPRAVAPERGIPDALAEVTLRLLAKAPEQRYQTADELSAALAQAAETLGIPLQRSSIPPAFAAVRCPACGASVAPTKFCGECAAPLAAAYRRSSPS